MARTWRRLWLLGLPLGAAAVPGACSAGGGGIADPPAHSGGTSSGGSAASDGSPESGGADSGGTAGTAGTWAGTAGTGGSSGTSSDGSGGTAGTGGGILDAAPDGPCIENTFVCVGTVKKNCTQGAWVDEECAPESCDPIWGCVTCIPNTGTCNGNISHRCKYDGSGYEDQECDPLQGVTCNAATGLCNGECAPDALGSSYIGCDYWPTVTTNGVWSQWFNFAAVVANTSVNPATVTVTQGASTISTTSIAGNSVQAITLPWVTALKGVDYNAVGSAVAPTANVLAVDGAYRLRSDRPVTVYQFSPLQYTNASGPSSGCPNPTGAGCFSFTNDASLMLPTNALGDDYIVGGWHAWTAAGMGAFAAITAVNDATPVEITAGESVIAGGGVGPLSVGQIANLNLDSGDVLLFFSAGGSAANTLSGTRIRSTNGAPIQVISGIPCVYIPEGVGYCDHMEEAVMPTNTVGWDYIVEAPLSPPGGNGAIQYSVRIVALEDGTDLQFDPAVTAPATLNKGQVLELASISADFHVWSTQKRFSVSAFQHGSNVFFGAGDLTAKGDPAQTFAVPTAQFRTSYKFLAPTLPNGGYDYNYVDVIAPTGTAVTLDGVAFSAAFTPIGASGWSVARQQIGDPSTVKQDHDISAAMPFGIQVYGYGAFTSYWYPGGLDLHQL